MSSKQERVDRYANAIWGVALEQWTTALNNAAKALSSDKKLTALLSDDSKPVADRIAALDKALPAGTTPEVHNLLKTMVEAGDLSLIKDVSGRLVQVASGAAVAVKAEVTSAIELTEKEKEQLRQRLSAQYGEAMTFTFQVDPSLLGGLRVRVGDKLIDTSIASRLATLRESLTSVVR